MAETYEARVLLIQMSVVLQARASMLIIKDYTQRFDSQLLAACKMSLAKQFICTGNELALSQPGNAFHYSPRPPVYMSFCLQVAKRFCFWFGILEILHFQDVAALKQTFWSSEGSL